MTDRIAYLRRKVETAKEARDKAAKWHHGQTKATRAHIAATSALLREEIAQARRAAKSAKPAVAAPGMLALMECAP